MKTLILLNVIATVFEIYLIANLSSTQPQPIQYEVIPEEIQPLEQFEAPLLEPEPIKSTPKTRMDPEVFSRMVQMIKRFESFKPTPYICAAGVRTIGYGFTESKYLKMKRMTEPQASKILVEDVIPRYQSIVRKYVKVPLTSNQECALISFTFNCGEGNLVKVVDARRNRLNKGNYNTIPSVLLRYTKVRIGNKVKTLNGLVTRRKQEAAMFAGTTI
jgi:GH24 family phage-related lysozyme (muramidase)